MSEPAPAAPEAGANTPASSALRAGMRPGLMLALVVSLTVHGTIFGVVLARAYARPHLVLPAERVITTRLVKLGEKPRPKEWLPRLPSTPPTVDEAAPVKPLAPEKAAPEPKLSLQERISRATRMQQALQRVSDRVEKPDHTGDPRGDPKNSVSSFTEQVLGNRYASQVKEAIMRRYVVPTIIDPQTCKRLKAVAWIRVGPDGRIIDQLIESTSGSAIFDNALLAAVQRTARLPPPPPEIARRVADDGIEPRAACHGERD